MTEHSPGTNEERRDEHDESLRSDWNWCEKERYSDLCRQARQNRKAERDQHLYEYTFLLQNFLEHSTTSYEQS